MKLKNKFIALATVLAMLGSSTNATAADGYYDSVDTANYAPAIALGAIAIIAIVAVAVQNSGHHHHGHH
jgi:hypothetical protein